MLYSMAALFQSQLKEADVITLAQELHYAKRYMELFEYRYLGKFSWKVNCGDRFLQVPIIKFVIQPVLENYFEHGIRLEAKDNVISLAVKEMGKFLLILVEDNGRGMAQGEMEKKKTRIFRVEMEQLGIQEVQEETEQLGIQKVQEEAGQLEIREIQEKAG